MSASTPSAYLHAKHVRSPSASVSARPAPSATALRQPTERPRDQSLSWRQALRAARYSYLYHAHPSRLSTDPHPPANLPPVDLDTSKKQPSPAWFEPTRWSMVIASAQTQAPGARDALSELCRTYWQPLYSFARRRGYDHHRAEDIIQSFFLSLLESKTLSRADPLKGKFRSYLLAALQNHMSSEHTRNNAQKRGGGMRLISIDDDDSEAKFIAAATATRAPAEAAFEREWAVAAVEAALARLAEDFARRGKTEIFEALKPYLTGDQPAGSYDKTAAKLNLNPGALRTGVHRLRADFRTHLRREIARTVETPDQIDEEMRHLRTVLAQRDLA